jgi:YihY family inner membrane protein
MANIKARLDEFQRGHSWAGFPFAVIIKFGEDRAANLAVLMAYYAFLSIFPLLLVLVTILGYVLYGHPHLQQLVFDSAIGDFPIIGQHNSFNALSGNPAGLIIGLILAIWSGLAVAQTAQTAFNTVYAVPRTSWPGFVPRLKRSVELVCLGGFGLIVTTLIQGVVSGTGSYGLQIGVGGQVAGAVIGLVLNFVLFGYLFRRLTVYSVGNRDVWPGAAVAAVAWFVLQKVGTALVNNKINGAQGTYGTFAVVIGLLFWFFLLSQITLLCAEINMVRSERLWPRSLSSFSAEATTRADVRAYSFYIGRERRAHNIEITQRLSSLPAVTGGAADGGAEGSASGDGDEPGLPGATGGAAASSHDQPAETPRPETTQPLRLPRRPG